MAQRLAVAPGGPVEHGAAGRVSGVRKVDLAPHKVLIFSNARSPEQQGRQRTGFNKSMPHWSMELLDYSEKWVNPLIGWTSTADSMQQAAVALQFYSADEAIAFANRQGWSYEVEQPNEPRQGRSRRWATYGDNFSVKRHGLPDLSHLPSNAASGRAAEGHGQGDGGK
ncbi:hypothetical protein GPECTOR_2g1223 [Gonium pectorale]|uniref:NADH dehydrogenase [ubiquinone] iron-sulfur protein 4, mitochondrial n=1 Tax=Gonium pectorale TaxID=33097 RepID=A0A150H0Z2_GONPE|nr:hypothetical protein GPECTOR_2g1223 [Gonium pectorale]|eukprot:KXZ55673.1 hypothetical protein GPECTOR_2g1223 [Gonium pectorale]